MAMQIGMGFGKFLARVLFQELGVSVPSSVFHVLFNTVSTCRAGAQNEGPRSRAVKVRSLLQWKTMSPAPWPAGPLFFGFFLRGFAYLSLATAASLSELLSGD